MSTSASSVTAFDAKNRLGSLLDRVVAGEELVITRHGQPVAKLVPVQENKNNNIDEALAVFAAVRASLKKQGKKISIEEIIAWKNEGRR